MSIIDAHCYLGDGVYMKRNSGDLLDEMDSHGVSHAVVNSTDQYSAVYNREGNDEIIRAVSEHPDRLTGFAVVNPWYGQKGADELRRCIESGLRGLSLDTRRQGCFFTDTIVRRLIQHAADLEIPVYCHTGTPIYALPLGLMELALDFPKVSFIMGSGGWADGWYDAGTAAKTAPNIFIETSYCAIPLIANAIRLIGAERILFGSDAPGSSLETELLKIRLLDLDARGREMILGDNAARLIGIRT